MGKTAILLGGTGLVGSHLLQLLIKDDSFGKVKLFGRSSVNISHDKLEEYILDLKDLNSHKEKFNGDVVFCCIGTTKSKTRDRSKYREIDYGIPVNAAELCKVNNIACFIVISALGADANSRIFYNRIKGDMEEAVLSKQINHTYILQPSLIGGNRDETRIGESIAKFLMNLIEPLMLGDLKKYRSIHPSTIAKAMLYLGKRCDLENQRIASDRIKKIAIMND